VVVYICIIVHNVIEEAGDAALRPFAPDPGVLPVVKYQAVELIVLNMEAIRLAVYEFRRRFLVDETGI